MGPIDTHFENAGEGKPVAVLFGPAVAWGPIWPALTGLTQVFRYDRGGLALPLRMSWLGTRLGGC